MYIAFNIFDFFQEIILGNDIVAIAKFMIMIVEKIFEE
jgi:hypothetical protein